MKAPQKKKSDSKRKTDVILLHKTQLKKKRLLFTECVLEVLDDRSLPGAVFPLHIVGRHKAGLVGGISDPPPGLGVVQEPQALVLLDVQLLVLLGHVVELGDDDHLLRHDELC